MPPAPEDTSVAAPVTPEPVPAPTFRAIEPDTTLAVLATATAANGAVWKLQMQVHRPIPYNDVAGQTLPKAMEADCAGLLNADIFAQQLWSFTRVNVTAVPDASTPAWPVDAALGIRPSASAVSIVGRGSLVKDPAAAGDAPSCSTDKFFSVQGDGGAAVGIPQDVAAGNPAIPGNKWLGHQYGFDASRAGGVVLSDCTIQVTAAGSAAGVGGASWAQFVDAKTCATGPPTEVREY